MSESKTLLLCNDDSLKLQVGAASTWNKVTLELEDTINNIPIQGQSKPQSFLSETESPKEFSHFIVTKVQSKQLTGNLPSDESTKVSMHMI